MRLNRNTRIGLALIGAALLFWIVSSVVGNILGGSRPPAADNAVVVEGGNEVTPVAIQGDMVAVATEPIPERSIITRGMFTMRPVPGADADAGYVTIPENQAIGFITQRALRPGDRIRTTDLVGHISQVGISGAIRPGLRAMIIAIPNKATLHDLLHVGDFVDVIAAFDQQEARTIVQNVRVLAVDVFGEDFPQVKIAARGDYKADAKGIDTANPPSPPGTAGPTTVTTGPGGTTTTNAPPPPPAGPTPGPNGQPPARPEASITLEVTPEQATAISLALAAQAPLDYVLRPRTPLVVTAPPAEARIASATRNRIAPYADAVKRRGQGGGTRTTATPADRIASSFNKLVDRVGQNPGGGAPVPSPSIPSPVGPVGIPPAPVGPTTQAEPDTLKIPIYGDGKLVRVDEVPRPSQ